MKLALGSLKKLFEQSYKLYQQAITTTIETLEGAFSVGARLAKQALSAGKEALESVGRSFRDGACGVANALREDWASMDPREQALMVFGVRVAAMIAVGAVCAATAVVGCMVTGAAVNAVDSAFFGCPEGQSKTSCAVVGGLTGAATAGFGKIPGGASAVGSMLRNGIEEGVHGIGVEYLDDTGRITPGTIAKSVAVGAVFGGAVRMGSHAVRRSGMTLTRGFIAGNSPHGSMLRGRSAIPDVTIRNTAGGFIAKRLRMIRADPERGSIGGQWPTPRRATALSTRSTFSGSSAVSGLFSVQGEQVECSDRRRTTLSGTGATTRSS